MQLYITVNAVPSDAKKFNYSKCPRGMIFLCLSAQSNLNVFKVSAFVTPPPISVWPHLFHGAGHEKRRGEQLKWSLAFTLYIASFLNAQLPGPVHTARLGQVCFFVYLA